MLVALFDYIMFKIPKKLYFDKNEDNQVFQLLTTINLLILNGKI